MEKDTLRMQFLSGVITESEYKAIINKEIEDAEKDSLNESMIGGIVGIGAINQIPPRAKADYETAFEHFLGEKYGLNEVEEEVGEGKEVEEPSLYEGEVNENVGSTINKILQTFEFSEKGNDEMIEFANYLLSPEGPKNIAMSIKSKLKGEGGENYFTSKPEELDAFLNKLKGDGTISDRIRSKSDYIAGIEDNEEESN
jgi:hypothetical protein